MQLEVIQSLWSGYGEIARYRLKGGSVESVVVKHIKLRNAESHPRGWNTQTSHSRKIRSYEVEIHWYKEWSHMCSDSCRVPRFLGEFQNENEKWIILEDLDAEFPLRKDVLELQEIKACLSWLAGFHAQFLHESSKSFGTKELWEIGTYWHLGTRPDEFEKMESSDLKTHAKEIDLKLNRAKFQTLVHGDAKLANFCFSKPDSNEESQIAAVDFQYVGRGCGMKDVAYFLGSCLGSDDLFEMEEELLAYYFEILRDALNNTNLNITELESEWRGLYPFAVADFTRFLMGWMPSHRKVNAYHISHTKKVILSLKQKTI
jgi:hypothetical protein